MNLPRRIFPGIAVSLAMLVNQGVSQFSPPPRNNRAKGRQLQMADKETLAARVESLNKAVNSFVATVDMTPSLGSVYKGEITEYKDVRGFILFRRPADIRIQAQYPVVRALAFDMVSNGNQFRFYLPAKNRFVIGSNDTPPIRKTNWKTSVPKPFWNRC